MQELIGEHRAATGLPSLANRPSQSDLNRAPLTYPDRPYAGGVRPDIIDHHAEGLARDASDNPFPTVPRLLNEQWVSDHSSKEKEDGEGSVAQAYRFVKGGTLPSNAGRGASPPGLLDTDSWGRRETGLSSDEQAEVDRRAAGPHPLSVEDQAEFDRQNNRPAVVREMPKKADEKPAPQRGALPAPPAVAEAKPNAEMPPVPVRPAAAQMEPDAPKPEVDPKKQAMKAEMDRRRSMADLRGIHPNTRVFFDKAVAGTEHDKNGDGRLSPDEWADMPALERGRMRREAHDQQRVHTQANYRDHVGTQNMARNEGLSYGHARARLQSGRAAEMIGQGNALMSSPQAEDRMRGRALIAQGEAMKEHADSAIKMHEGLVAQNASAQNDAFFKNMMMGGANHRNPALGANVVNAAGGVLEQQAMGVQREADRQVARERNDADANNAAADRAQRGELADKQREIALAEIDAKMTIVDKEIAAHERAGNLKEKIAAEERKQDLEFKRATLLNDNRRLVLQEEGAARDAAKGALPAQQEADLMTPIMNAPLAKEGPTLQDMERDFEAKLSGMGHLDNAQREEKKSAFNRFARTHVAQRLSAGPAYMRQGDWRYLEQAALTQLKDQSYAMMDKASFIEGILQHYDGDNPQGLQEKLSKFYDVYKARRATLVGDPNGKNPSASLGVNEAHAFTA
jgi:hypothetical protein